jgi:putative FmdB family regulatory protein
MPIYAYRCESCGFAQDTLRKMSDPPLSICPECGKDTFRKQVTAAGFQLKGSGWYVTDFRNNGSAPAKGSKKDGESGTGTPAAAAEGGSASGGEGGGEGGNKAGAKSGGDSDSKSGSGTGSGAASGGAAPSGGSGSSGASPAPASSSGSAPSSGGTTSS